MENAAEMMMGVGDGDKNSEGSESKVVRTRRTRSVTEGRDWICIFCKRAYLSIGSVVYHVRLKHMDQAKADDFITSLLKSPRKPKQEEKSNGNNNVVNTTTTPNSNNPSTTNVAIVPPSPVAPIT